MLSPYKTCGCRQTGILHVLNHRPCEDHTAVSVSPDGCTAITLADGAGSCSRASEGAQITSSAAAEYLANNFASLWQMSSDHAAHAILNAVLTRLAADAKSADTPIREYSSTLLAAAAAPDGRFLLLHIGDGVILGLDCSGECHVLSRYEHTGPSNLTTFVTVPDTPYFIQQGDMGRSGICAFALMSDGVEEKLVNELGCDPHAQLMMQLFFFLSGTDMNAQLKGLFQLMQNNGASDDLSVNLLADKRCTDRIFSAASSTFRRDVLDLPIGSHQVKRLTEVLRAVALHPADGMTFRQLSRALYLHSPRFAEQQAMRLVEAGLLTLSGSVLRVV